MGKDNLATVVVFPWSSSSSSAPIGLIRETRLESLSWLNDICKTI